MAGLSRKPRLLFLCHTLPYPPDGGVWIRTYHVLRMLARAFDVTMLCFERAGGTTASDVDVAASHDALRQLGEVEVFPLPQRSSALRFAYDHARSLCSGRVWTTYLYDSRPFRRRLNALLRDQTFDLVHIDSLDLAGYLQDCRGLPVVVVHHNVESHLLARRAAIERRPLVRAYIRHQARLMTAVERHSCPRVSLNVAVSQHDADLLRRIAPRAAISLVPNGVDIDAFSPVVQPDAGIAGAGGASWFPNRDALDFFCVDVLPHLRRELNGVPVRWIGRATAEQQEQYRGRYGVELTGYAADVRPLMQEARCHVVPLRIGGGTRLKILNSWAMGKAVVSTSIGCEGLAAVDGQNILIRDEPAAFAAAVATVLRDDELRCRLGAQARSTVERLYSWDVIGQPMIDDYLRLVRGPSDQYADVTDAIGRERPTVHV